MARFWTLYIFMCRQKLEESNSHSGIIEEDRVVGVGAVVGGQVTGWLSGSAVPPRTRRPDSETRMAGTGDFHYVSSNLGPSTVL